MVAFKRVAWVVAPLLLVLTSGCTGVFDDSYSPESNRRTGPAVIDPNAPSPTPLRRLNHTEYRNSVRSLFGPGLNVQIDLPSEIIYGGYDTEAQGHGVAPSLAEQYVRLAEALGEWAAQNWAHPTGCVPADRGSRVCAQELIEFVGLRAFRRPLDGSEVDTYLFIFDEAEADGGWASGVKWTIAALLQSPMFLYRVERGDDLTDHEIATRLSYLFWATAPDDGLLDIAAEGGLSDPAALEALATTVLEDERARPVIRRFMSQWLQLSRLDDVVKDGERFPQFDEELRERWRTETHRFIDEVVWTDVGTPGDFFDSSFSVIDQELAGIYRVDAVPDGFSRIALDPNERAGLLTQGSFLAIQATNETSSPIHRGAFVRNVLLCDEIPPPPDDLEVTEPQPDPEASVREQLDALTSGPSCVGCHSRINPVGYAFERYDAIGQYREQDEFGHAVDDSGELVGFQEPELEGSFSGPVELSHRIARSHQLRTCFVRNVFHFAHGRRPTRGDEPSIQEVAERLEREQLSVQGVFVAMTQMPAFLSRY